MRADGKVHRGCTFGLVTAQVIRPEAKNRPLLVTEPGNHDPLSLSLELSQINDQVAETRMATN